MMTTLPNGISISDELTDWHARNKVRALIYPRCQAKNRRQRQRLMKMMCAALPDWPIQALRTITYAGNDHSMLPHFVVRFPQHDREATRRFANALPKQLGALLFSGGCIVYCLATLPANHAVAVIGSSVFAVHNDQYDDFYCLVQALDYAKKSTSLISSGAKLFGLSSISDTHLVAKLPEFRGRVSKLERVRPPVGLDFDGDVAAHDPIEPESSGD